MPALLYYSKQDPADLWATELRAALPADIEVRLHPDIGDPAVTSNTSSAGSRSPACWRPSRT